jgi:hypothetical protein
LPTSSPPAGFSFAERRSSLPPLASLGGIPRSAPQARCARAAASSSRERSSRSCFGRTRPPPLRFAWATRITAARYDVHTLSRSPTAEPARAPPPSSASPLAWADFGLENADPRGEADGWRFAWATRITGARYDVHTLSRSPTADPP